MRVLLVTCAAPNFGTEVGASALTFRETGAGTAVVLSCCHPTKPEGGIRCKCRGLEALQRCKLLSMSSRQPEKQRRRA